MLFFFQFLFLNLVSIIYCGVDDILKSDQHDMEADDYQYDHNVILGRGQSSIFDKLTPEESKSRLSDIVDKMDLNKDGSINIVELTSWIRNGFATILNEDMETQWKEIVKEDVDKIDFDTYLSNMYKSGIDGDRASLVKMEKRRWAAADLDKDDFLNKTELFRFIHPEEFKDLKPLLAQESLEELDKNGDGFVDIDEYLKDVFPEGREVKEEWVRHERQNFGYDRDKNKDGFLDRDEIQSWLLPESYNRVEAEADHIMERAGAGEDKILTKKDILEKYYVFVGSQTDKPYEGYMGHEDL